MARLIDADALLEQYNLKDATKYGNKDAEQQAHSYSTMMLYEIADMIEDAPTAYDLDKVVEKLEEVKNKDTEIALDEAQKERCFWYAQGMNRAIEIVKGGGVDEQSITDSVQHRYGSGDSGRKKDGDKACDEDTA